MRAFLSALAVLGALALGLLLLTQLLGFEPDASKTGAARGPAAIERAERAEDPHETELAAAATTHDTTGTSAAAPLSTEETVEPVVERGRIGEPVDNAPAVVGRIVDAEGAPLRRLTLQVTPIQREPGAPRSRVHIGTDARGRFRLPLHDENVELRALEFIHAGETPLGARFELVEPWVSGVNDVGDITLADPPRIVEGRVLDDIGRPIHGAKIHVRLLDPADAEEAAWNGSIGARAMSLRDGSFDVRGWVGPGPIALTARHNDYRGASRERTATVGSSELELVLSRAGELAGRVLLDEDLPTDVFSIHLSAANAGPRAQRRSTKLGATGAFRIDRLDPDTYTLTVEAAGEHLATIDAILVAPGDAPADARLENIDLRGRLHLFEFAVVDTAGEPIPEASLRYSLPDSRDLSSPITSDARGRLRILSTHSPLDLEISAPEFRTSIRAEVHTNETLVLEPGLPIRVTLTPSAPHLDPGYSLKLVLTPTGKRSRTAGGTIDPTSDLTLRLSAPGSYRLQLSLVLEDATTRRIQPIDGTSRNITVADTPAEQLFGLQLPTEGFRKAQALLEQRR